MAEDGDARALWQPPEASPPRERLGALVGEWTMEGAHPLDPAAVARGRAAFEWLVGGHFLVQRWEVEHPDFPDGIQIIGWDDAAGHYAAHYFDSRGIARRYEMSLGAGLWTVWRDDPGFSQRFTGTFGDDGRTITGRWERSSDGATWEHDFDLTYTRVT